MGYHTLWWYCQSLFVHVAFWGEQIACWQLTDYGKGDKKKVEELRKTDSLCSGHILTADEYSKNKNEADIEDILGRSFYIELVNSAYDLHGKHKIAAAAPAGASERVAEEVKQHFMTQPPSIPEYDHYTPAKYLLENVDTISAAEVDAALGRFEKLFADINALLHQ